MAPAASCLVIMKVRRRFSVADVTFRDWRERIIHRSSLFLPPCSELEGEARAGLLAEKHSGMLLILSSVPFEYLIYYFN